MFPLLTPPRLAPKQSESELPSASKARRRKRYLPIWECVAILIALGLWHWGKWQPFENMAYKMLYQSRQAVLPNEGWDDRLAVIAIDDATLETLDQFPLPRSYYAELLQTLSFSLPAAVSFDVLFSESSPDDEELSLAIADSWNVVLAIADGLGDSSMELVPELAHNSAAIGHVHAVPDSDGTIRKIDLYQENLVDGSLVPSLAIATLQVYQESLALTAGEAVPDRPSSFVEPLATTLQPQVSLRQQDAWVNWPAPINSIAASSSSCESNIESGKLRVYSFACVLDQQIPTHAFENKIVLIGTTAQSLDPMIIPFHRDQPKSGVFLHAALIDNILNDRLLQRPPRWAEGILIALLGIGMVIVMQRLNLVGRIIVLVGLPLLWFVGSVGALQASWWLPVAAPIGTVMLVFTSTQIREQLDKQQLMNLFEIYVSPETARHIWQNKQNVLTKGQSDLPDVEELTATILFIDIRGFTTISEGLPPERLMVWLNRYFDTMTACILKHGGRVDKYIGDEIMAVFGNPDQSPSAASDRHNAQCAIAASLAMHEELRHLNHEFIAEGLPTVQFGIGIHTGTVVAGNLGGARRFNYSVVGDTVNVASRLQGLNKKIIENNPFHVLISRTTREYVGDRYASQSVGNLKLRGREQELLVYSLQEPQDLHQL